MAKFGPISPWTSKRSRAYTTARQQQSLGVVRAIGSATERARAYYGESFSDVVAVVNEVRARQGLHFHKTTKYKRKLGRRAATLAVIETLDLGQTPTTDRERVRAAASKAAYEVSRKDWKTLLSVELSGDVAFWSGFVRQIAESGEDKLQATAPSSQEPSLLQNTDAALRALIEFRPDLRKRAQELERRTSFVLIPRTAAGDSFLKRQPGTDIKPYLLNEHTRKRIAAIVHAAGAQISYEGRVSLTVECSAQLAATFVGQKLQIEVPSLEEGDNRLRDIRPQLLYVRPVPGSIGRPMNPAIADFSFVPPAIPTSTVSSKQPTFSHPHLTHDQVRQVLGAGNACLPWTGGSPTVPGADFPPVKVAVIDTGCDATHPIFQTVGGTISYAPTGAAPKPHEDQDGHGTAMAWCVLMTAPNAEIVVAAHAGNNPDQALDAAWVFGAQVVCCSWQIPYQGPGTYLEEFINTLIDDGLIVLSAAGNGKPSWPGDMPRVISVGGVYVDRLSFDTRPSSYTSWYESVRYKGRIVPDVCGISGDLPRGVFLPLPCPPSSTLDIDYGSAIYDGGDGLATDDGWIFASGSSAATAQVAGVVALLIEKARSSGRPITQDQVKNWLLSGSIPVKIANNGFFTGSGIGAPTPIHPGLVNASASLSLV